MWWALAALVVSIILQVALAPKPAEMKPATLSDMNVPQVDEGTPQAVWFGENWTGDWQVGAYGNFRTKKVKAKQAKK